MPTAVDVSKRRLPVRAPVRKRAGRRRLVLNYTDAQAEAIRTIDGNLQIIACAGSGKTRVVAARVVHILKHGGPQVSPDNIVAFTFTEKAAAELKDRITKLYREEFGNVEGLAGMYVGTIHAFCLDLLTRYLDEYLKFDVLDEVKQRLLIDRNYVKSGMKRLNLTRWAQSKTFINMLSLLRGHLPATEKEAATSGDAACSLTMYRALLDEHRYFDYDELLVRATQVLLQDPSVASAVGTRVKYLTVDEYQDVSPVQETLIHRLHDLGANLCVVGDDDQNIYEWRGSDLSNIVAFPARYPNVRQVPLELNFRSSAGVISVARRAVEANPNRIAKEMRAGGFRQFARGDILALKFADGAAEADWIAAKIEALQGLPYLEDGERLRGLAWSDCAVLLRSVRGSGQPIIDALRARHIPFVVKGMTGLFDTPEAAAAVAIFRYLTGATNRSALLESWLVADLGVSETELKRGIDILDRVKDFASARWFSDRNLQRTFLDFLEAIGLREERIPQGRGEVVYYNLGKFSQVISDFEEVHFKTPPQSKFEQFVEFLRYQAGQYYPEGGQDAGFAEPNAVRIMTVHQAKGTEYPAVFLPCLQRNRFPAKRQHNAVWGLVDRSTIPNADRYDNDIEDERRLFYVALTRSEKFIFASWAPDASNRLYGRPSEFWEELTHRQEVLTREVPLASERLPSEPRRSLGNVEMSFSELKYFFECPYQFKLRFLYGFNPPLVEKLGYGRSLHNMLAEVHRRALSDTGLGPADVPGLVDRHMNVRYAFEQLESDLKRSAAKAVGKYLTEHQDNLKRLVHAEEMVELTLPDGIVVHGRIDLIRRTDTDEVVVVDFKSTERAQAEDVTRLQLHVYALGYQQRFGTEPDLIEVHNLDRGGSTREVVDPELVDGTVALVRSAGERLRENKMERLTSWCGTCSGCDFAGICRTRPMGART